MRRSRQHQSTPSWRSNEPAHAAPAPAPPASAPPASGPVTTAEVEDLLRKLAESTRAASTSGSGEALDELVGDTTGHADRLRATMNAQQEANELLAVAQRVRGAAAEQAEQILAEARQSAERLLEETRQATERVRREAADQARLQQEQVETLVRDLRESATRDADRIRGEALGTAMAEAERTARQYTAQAIAQGTRDADAIRDEARDLLHQSTSLMALAAGSLQELAGTISTFVDGLQTQTKAMEVLRDDAERREAAHAAPAAEVSTSGAEASAAVATSAEPARGDFGDSEDDAAGRRPLGSLFRGPAGLTDELGGIHKDR